MTALKKKNFPPKYSMYIAKILPRIPCKSGYPIEETLGFNGFHVSLSKFRNWNHYKTASNWVSFCRNKQLQVFGLSYFYLNEGKSESESGDVSEKARVHAHQGWDLIFKLGFPAPTCCNNQCWARWKWRTKNSHQVCHVVAQTQLHDSLLLPPKVHITRGLELTLFPRL